MNPERLWIFLHHHLNSFVLEAIVPHIFVITVATTLLIPFTLLDIVGCPKSLLKFKVHPEYKPPSKDLRKCFPVSFFNLFIVKLLCDIPIWFLYKWRGCRSDLPTPNVLELLVHLISFIFIEDVAFYAMHRAFHSSTLFGRFHKKHHEYCYSFALIGVYSHPVDFICKHVLVPTLGPLLFRSHTITRIIWYMMAISYNIFHHSGYSLPMLPSSDYHSHHHYDCAWNFGVMGFMDFAFNTDCVQFRRHSKKKKIR